MKKTIIFFFLIYSVSAFSQYGNNGSFNKEPLNYLRTPNSIADCINQLDSIFIDEIKNRFKAENKDIGVIHISNDLAIVFISRWNLDFYKKREISNFYGKKRLEDYNFLNSFIDEGIEEPKMMMRVIFSCYHDYLNDLNYSLDKEIFELKKNIISNSNTKETDNKTKLYLRFLEEYEDQVLDLYNLSKISKQDTIGYYFFDNSREIRNYISGIVTSKNQDKYKLNFVIFDIASSMRYDYVFLDSDTVFVGDTMSSDISNIVKVGTKHFDYYSNQERLKDKRWQTYINEKY